VDFGAVLADEFGRHREGVIAFACPMFDAAGQGFVITPEELVASTTDVEPDTETEG
jgi:hypothetical protein